MTYYNNQSQNISTRLTLNDLKDQMYSLNMQLLLAMQYHNEEMQDEIQKQVEDVQDKIEQMNSGHRSGNESS